MNEFRLEGVDLCNPCEFFACCGLLEIAERLHPGAEGWFDARASRTGAFCMRGWEELGDGFIATAVRAIADSRPEMVDEGYGSGSNPWQCGKPLALRLDWWLEPGRTKSELKTWSAKQTPARLIGVRIAAAEEAVARCQGPELFRHEAAVEGGLLGLNPNAVWTSLDAGFSPDKQETEVVAPVVAELLAMFGLERLRPARRGECFEYVAWDTPLPAVTAAGAPVCASGRRFEFKIVSRVRDYRYYTMAQERKE